MSFTEDIQAYDKAMLPGVRLPKIDIENKYYERLNLEKSVDNFTFLKTLCYSKLTESQNNLKSIKVSRRNLIFLKSLSLLDYVYLIGIFLIFVTKGKFQLVLVEEVPQDH